MNKPKISIVDYEMGNLKSIVNAFEAIGAETEIIDTPEKVMGADYLVIPGVGAFKEGMEKLKSKKLVEAIREYAKSGKPLLGICLGMQFLMEESEEFGISHGLGIIEGKVSWLKSFSEGEKVPHIGWDKVFSAGKWNGTMLSVLKEGEEMYFVHSFVPVPKNKEDILAVFRYGGKELCAAVKKGNVIGCQFHPEKSGKIGLEMLKIFSGLS